MERTLSNFYLNDHLAGATTGVELALRAARSNTGSELGDFLGDVLLPEIREDRQTLERLVGQLGIERSRPKVAAAWAPEKVGG